MNFKSRNKNKETKKQKKKRQTMLFHLDPHPGEEYPPTKAVVEGGCVATTWAPVRPSILPAPGSVATLSLCVVQWCRVVIIESVFFLKSWGSLYLTSARSLALRSTKLCTSQREELQQRSLSQVSILHSRVVVVWHRSIHSSSGRNKTAVHLCISAFVFEVREVNHLLREHVET